MITSRMLDNRKIITVGASIIIGVSHESLQQYYHHALPSVFLPVTLSSVAMATTCATLLSLIFRFRAKTHLRKDFIVKQSSLDDVIDFLEQQGKAWGAQPAVVKRAEYATWQAFETLFDHDLVANVSEGVGTISLETVYDEFFFTVVLRYHGELLSLDMRPPSHEQLLNDDGAVKQMAGYLMRKLADKVHVRLDSTGLVVLSLTFKD